MGRARASPPETLRPGGALQYASDFPGFHRIMPPSHDVPDAVDKNQDARPAYPIPGTPVPRPPHPATPRRGRMAGMAAVLVLIGVTLARAFGAPSWLFMVAGAAAFVLIVSGYALINPRLRTI